MMKLMFVLLTAAAVIINMATPGEGAPLYCYYSLWGLGFCEIGFECVHGVCVAAHIEGAPIPCDPSDGGDCGTGSFCVDGVCVEEGGEEGVDEEEEAEEGAPIPCDPSGGEDCGAGSVCVDRVCVEEGGEEGVDEEEEEGEGLK